MKKVIKFSAFLLAAYMIFAVIGTAVFADSSAAERVPLKFGFSDESGISFSADVFPCTAGKNDGEIHISVTSAYENGDRYFYSTNCGRSFKEMKGRNIRLMNAGAQSYSLRIKKTNGKTEAVTNVCTVNAAARDDSGAVVIYAESVPERIYGDGSMAVYIGNFEADKKYEISVNGGAKWSTVSSKKITAHNLKNGTYSVLARVKDEPETTSLRLSVPVPEPISGKKASVKVKRILQTPELPTGCEVTSLTMLLNHIGFKADKLKLADRYLPKGEYRAADPHKVFVGDPRDIYAYGCFSEVIVQTAENYLKKYDKKGRWRVINISGCTPNALYAAIDNDTPVIVWASINMDSIEKNSVSWTDTETGETISWTGGEHCLLLTGYDKNKKLIYANDPLRGKVSYDKKLFEKRFKQLGCNAVIIIPNEDK